MGTSVSSKAGWKALHLGERKGGTMMTTGACFSPGQSSGKDSIQE